MENKLNWLFIVLFATALFSISSCQKNNFDNTESTTEEIEPEIEYTGTDNEFYFTLGYTHMDSTTVLGGSTLNTNSIEKEELAGGGFRWTLESFITDGITVTNRITFVTPNADAGVYPIESIYFSREDDAGNIFDERFWEEDEIENNGITVSDLGDSPGIVSGSTGDVLLDGVDVEGEFWYGAGFSEVPINN